MRASWQAAWRLDVPYFQLANPSVDHLFLVIDVNFPLSEPRVIAPQAAAKGAPAWPHVEKDGLLCLSTTRFSDDAGRRCLSVLQDALDVLDLDEAARVAEFRHEFVSYWLQRSNRSPKEGLALLRPEPVDRDIYYHSGRGAQIVFADSELHLEHWLKCSGLDYRKPFLETRLVWPAGLDTPHTYPKLGRDVIDLIGQKNLEDKFPVGGKFPVVLGMMFGTAAVFAGAMLTGPTQQFLSRGFRPSRPRPQRYVAEAFRARDIEAFRIERVDAAWVHGRDANAMLTRLAEASAALIGCGAIGGYIARGLMQAGIGTLHLVDHDSLKAANLGRHVLGAEWIGRLKATALSQQLARDFPHAKPPFAHTCRFQDLSSAELAELASCDVVVLAGIDLPAELAVDRWTAGLTDPPPRVWTWTEEFAHAGHAVALFNQDLIQHGLDADGKFVRRSTTTWDPNISTLPEAACGTSFQPYDAIDMMQTVLMAQRLVTDITLARLTTSAHRAWYGDRSAVVALGATPSAEFDCSFVEKAFPWEP